MWAREDGIPVDKARWKSASAAPWTKSSRDRRGRIDIVNDGEWGKPSYATYIKDRLNGFGGTGNTFVFQDIEAFPADEGARLCRSRTQAPQDAGVQRADQRARRGGAAQDAERLKTRSRRMARPVRS